jgi:hypothetical protein
MFRPHPQLKRLVAVHVGCVVVKVTLGRGILTVLWFFPVTVIASVFDTHISLTASLNKTLHRNTQRQVKMTEIFGFLLVRYGPVSELCTS